MGKILAKEKDIQKLEIPRLSLFNVNIYKFERERIYVRHKLTKKLRKEVRA
jgi:hypothetical protein